jgi:hypothetical protein
MAEAESLAAWECEVLEKQAAEEGRDAALRTARAILDAYERGILPIGARYLADTLRMVLAAVDAAHPVKAARD